MFGVVRVRCAFGSLVQVQVRSVHSRFRIPSPSNSQLDGTATTTPDTPPATPKPPVPKTLKQKREADKESFDIGDAVYSVENFKKTLHKHILDDILPEKTAQKLHASGETNHVEIPNFDYATFKEVFKDALREYHQKEGSKKLDEQQDQPSEAPPQRPSKQIVPQAPTDPLDAQALQNALTFAREQRSRFSEQSARAINAVDPFDEPEHALRDEFALGPHDLKSHIIREPVPTHSPVLDILNVRDSKRRKNIFPREESIRQKQASKKVLDLLDDKHSSGTLFSSEVLNYGIVFTRVRTTRDLRKAHVYWSFSDVDARLNIHPFEVGRLLRGVKSKVRHVVTNGVNMKYSPEIVFEQDMEDEQEQETEMLLALIDEQERQKKASRPVQKKVLRRKPAAKTTRRRIKADKHEAGPEV